MQISQTGDFTDFEQVNYGHCANFGQVKDDCHFVEFSQVEIWQFMHTSQTVGSSLGVCA